MHRRLTACAVLMACALLGPLTVPAHSDPDLLLPDLVTIPSFLQHYRVRRTHGRVLLVFPVPIFNQGRGPLEMRGSRRSTRVPMTSTQIVYTSDGGNQSFSMGGWRYDRKYHRWHVVDIADYCLLDAHGAEVSDMPKVSCYLQDDRPIDRSLPGAPRVNKYRSRAHDANARTLKLRMGISVGWADVYDTSVPFQYIDITGIPHGDYTLKVTINPDGELMESNPNNNTAEVPVKI